MQGLQNICGLPQALQAARLVYGQMLRMVGAGGGGINLSWSWSPKKFFWSIFTQFQLLIDFLIFVCF